MRLEKKSLRTTGLHALFLRNLKIPIPIKTDRRIP